jgi:SAM-dependent methyltransferase
MKTSLQLLKALVRTAPFQPATNYWRAVELDAVLRHGFPSGRGLDLGCGDGKLTRVVLDGLSAGPRAATSLVGIDLDPLETEQAAQTGLYERVHTCSATAIPEASASFDFVFSNSVLEHIGPIDEVLAEAARLLKPQGRFLLTVPGPDFHRCLAGAWLQRGDSAEYRQLIDERCAHLRYWDLATWRQHLERCGLTVSVSSAYLTRGQVQRWEFLSSITAGLLYLVYRRRQRPIEIQRKLKMRSAREGWLGRVVSVLSPVVTWGRPTDADVRADLHGCLLIDAVKR